MEMEAALSCSSGRKAATTFWPLSLRPMMGVCKAPWIAPTLRDTAGANPTFAASSRFTSKEYWRALTLTAEIGVPP